MSRTVIKVEGLGKKYRIGQAEKRPDNFREAIVQGVTAPLRRLRKLRSEPSSNDEFWALKDVSFEVQEGEVVGIIGANGAGKSTLLKILSRITTPTEGRAVIRGQVSSLLEVGTGFHPELTGRENIYLNGTILGMSHRDIRARFDEIVDFAGVEAFIDTPIKRYSSGMSVRLAFAVAAHLGTDIMIVDEVLAVGDIAFQQKCVSIINDISRSTRTIIFVSHNMGIIQRLCPRTMLTEAGQVIFDGPTPSAILRYSKNQAQAISTLLKGPFANNLRILDTHVNGRRFDSPQDISPSSPIEITVDIECQCPSKEVQVFLPIYRSDQKIIDLNECAINDSCSKTFSVVGYLPPKFLSPGYYDIGITIVHRLSNNWSVASGIARFGIVSESGPGYDISNIGVVNLAGTVKRFDNLKKILS